MIETRVDQMLSLMRDGKILSENAFSKISLTEALRLRDLDEPYRHFNDQEIIQRWKILPLHPDIRGAFDELHELTYSIAREQVRRFTDAEDDTTHLVLPDRITQEIDYIAMCRGTQFFTEWYDELWACYLRDEIPMIVAEPMVSPLI